MTQVLYPGSSWVFKFGGYEGTSSVVINSVTVASIDTSGTKFKFISDSMSTDYEAWFYYVNEDGISISDENKIYFNIKATSIPSFFDTFEIYLEDCNGITATYGLTDMLLGKENTLLLTALVRAEDFNDSFVVKIGFHIKNPKSSRAFTATLSDLYLSLSENPTYCTPQEVADFLMMVDNSNSGAPFKVSETSRPSYNILANRIVEAEAFIENTTRQAWTERRVDGEIRNVETGLTGAGAYYSIYIPSGGNFASNNLYRGAPVKLTRVKVRDIDYTKGDLVEIRLFGSSWETVPQDNVWMDGRNGIMFIKSIVLQKDFAVRVTYRYGYGPVPKDIKRATLLKTAMLIVQTDWFRQKFAQSPGFDPLRSETINMWTWELKDLMRPWSDYVITGGI